MFHVIYSFIQQTFIEYRGKPCLTNPLKQRDKSELLKTRIKKLIDSLCGIDLRTRNKRTRKKQVFLDTEVLAVAFPKDLHDE
jgi:hypothetical protein